MSPGDWGLLFAAALLLGSTFLFIEIAIVEIPPLTAAVVRRRIVPRHECHECRPEAAVLGECTRG